MIKINLAPYEENQDKLWFLPDLSVLAAAYLLGYLASGYNLRATEDAIADLKQKTEAEKTVMTQLSPRVREVKSIKAQIDSLSSRRESMSKITDSKLNRYLPIILFEHLQNLKPEGLWFTSASMAEKPPIDLEAKAQGPLTPTDPKAPPNVQKPENPANVNRPGNSAPVYIVIEGNAFNPALIAEFMTSLRATRNQDADASDLRTQVFFPKVGLVDLSVSPAQLSQSGGQKLVRFNFYVAHEERKIADVPRGDASSQGGLWQPPKPETNQALPAADKASVPKVGESNPPNVSLAPAIEVPL